VLHPGRAAAEEGILMGDVIYVDFRKKKVETPDERDKFVEELAVAAQAELDKLNSMLIENADGYATGNNPVGYDEYCPYEDYD
jgi:hypothetical protein